MRRLCVAILAGAMALPAAVSIRSDFEGGSIGRIEQAGPDHYRCAVKGEVDQDKRNRQASWYYFRVDGAAGHEITLDLTDLPGEYNYRPGNLAINGATRPFISYDRSTWTPLPDRAVEWDAAAAVLRLRFTPERNPVWIAHVPPYTGSELSALLKDVEASPYGKREAIGKSAGGRDIVLLTVTNPARPAIDKRVIWVMARQHAWETGTSWVMDGALRFLIADAPEAARLRDRFLFKFFPMADPDGVARGGVRFNAHGYDVNRNWDVADPKRMPEIAALRKTVLDWVDGGRPVDLFLSLHNTNSDYLSGPVSAGGPVYRDMVKRLAAMLNAHTIYSPGAPRDWVPGDPQPGRADACEGLFRDRGISTLLLEQNVQTLAKLGHPASVEDYRKFGSQLLPSLASAVDGRTRGPNLIANPGFATGGAEMPEGWSVWASRENLRPKARVVSGAQLQPALARSAQGARPSASGKPSPPSIPARVTASQCGTAPPTSFRSPSACPSSSPGVRTPGDRPWCSAISSIRPAATANGGRLSVPWKRPREPNRCVSNWGCAGPPPAPCSGRRRGSRKWIPCRTARSGWPRPTWCLLQTLPWKGMWR